VILVPLQPYTDLNVFRPTRQREVTGLIYVFACLCSLFRRSGLS